MSAILALLKNPYLAVLGLVLIATVSFYGMWQGTRADLLKTQRTAAIEAQQQAEKRSAYLTKQLEDLNARHAALAAANRQIDADLADAATSIEKWKKRYAEAIKDPRVDGIAVNTYAERLFVDVSCATGARGKCSGGASGKAVSSQPAQH